LVGLCILALPVVFLAVAAWHRRWIADDGFINLRVVQQILAGHGPVFNRGERVEIATSPLWTYVLLVSSRLLWWVRLEWTAVIVGISCMLAAVALAEAGALVLARRSNHGRLPIPLGAVIFVALSPVWDFSTSGLEVAIGLLWLAVTFLAIATELTTEEPRPQPRWWLPVLVGLGPLVRPDFALFSLAYLAVLLLRRTWSGRARIVGLTAAVPVAYELFRISYYGALVPNTAFAKEAFRSDWAQGWRYLADFNHPYRLWVPLALVAVPLLAVSIYRLGQSGGPNSMATAALALLLPVSGLLNWTYIVRLGGDFMHGRMLLPGLFAMLLPIAAIRPRSTDWMALGVLVWASVVIVSARPRYHNTVPVSPHGIADERAFYATVTKSAHPVVAADYRAIFFYTDGVMARASSLRHEHVLLLRAGDTGTPLLTVPGKPKTPVVLATGNVGVSSYVAGPDVYIFDIGGLGDPIGGRLAVSGRTRPGHDKHVDWVWAIARFSNQSEAPGDPSTDSPVLARVALSCGALRDVLAAATEPLSWGRVIGNVEAAFRLYSVRFSGDPATDVARFCR
jgi:arabinofuranosyltransferase